MIKFISAFWNNTFVFTFTVYFIGFLSLGFLGQENKTIRIATAVVALAVVFLKVASSGMLLVRNRLSMLLFLYICSLLPSLLFSEMFFMSVFKILDIVVILLIVSDSVRSFLIKELRMTAFHFVLYYFIIQSIFILGGYFFDPNAVREDLLKKGVTFLSSNYPKIHSNTVGTFGGVVILYAIFRVERLPKRKILNFSLLALGLSVLYLSSSRTGMIATIIGSGFLILKIFSGKQKRWLLALAVLALVYFNADIYHFGLKALMKVQTEETLANADNATDVLLSGRLSLWEIILEHPENLVFGRGFGTAMLTEDAMSNTNAHNSIVELLINAGAIAVVFWLLIWWKLVETYRYINRNKRFLPLHPNYYHLAFSLLILIFIKSMANITFVYFQLFDWLMVSIICLFMCTEIKIKDNKKRFKNVLFAGIGNTEKTKSPVGRQA